MVKIGEALRYEQIDGLAKYFIGCITECLRGREVKDDDPLFTVDYDNGCSYLVKDFGR